MFRCSSAYARANSSFFPATSTGPDEADVHAIQVRFHLLVEIGLVLDDARNDQPPAAQASHFNGQVDALIRVNPAEKNQVVAAPFLKGIQRQVDSVVHGRNVVQPRHAGLSC